MIGNYVPSGLRSGLLPALARFAREPRRSLKTVRKEARYIYLYEVVRLELIARTRELRLAGRIAPEKATAVRRIARLSSARSLAWLVARSARDLRGDSETLGAENQLTKGVLWSGQHGALAGIRRQFGR